MDLFLPRIAIHSRVLAVLGMHRSGTSCLAGSLQNKGLYLGEVPEWNPHNLKGNRENETIANLNEAVLNFNQASWHQVPRRVKWKRAHAKRRNEVIAGFEKAAVPVWGFKDPRVTLTLPFWLDAIPQLEFVGTYRHPALVAESLQRRDNMPLDYALELWCGYNECMLAQFARRSFPIVSFDLPSDAYQAQIDHIAKALQLPQPHGDAFIEGELKTTEPMQDDSWLSDRARSLYARLRDAEWRPQASNSD